jgi:hypothetical protein
MTQKPVLQEKCNAHAHAQRKMASLVKTRNGKRECLRRLDKESVDL